MVYISNYWLLLVENYNKRNRRRTTTPWWLKDSVFLLTVVYRHRWTRANVNEVKGTCCWSHRDQKAVMARSISLTRAPLDPIEMDRQRMVNKAGTWTNNCKTSKKKNIYVSKTKRVPKIPNIKHAIWDRWYALQSENLMMCLEYCVSLVLSRFESQPRFYWLSFLLAVQFLIFGAMCSRSFFLIQINPPVPLTYYAVCTLSSSVSHMWVVSFDAKGVLRGWKPCHESAVDHMSGRFHAFNWHAPTLGAKTAVFDCKRLHHENSSRSCSPRGSEPDSCQPCPDSQNGSSEGWNHQQKSRSLPFQGN